MTNLLEKRIQIVLLPLFREFVSQPPERIQSIEKKERKKERKKKTCDQNPASYLGFIVSLFRIIKFIYNCCANLFSDWSVTEIQTNLSA